MYNPSWICCYMKIGWIFILGPHPTGQHSQFLRISFIELQLMDLETPPLTQEWRSTWVHVVLCCWWRCRNTSATWDNLLFFKLFDNCGDITLVRFFSFIFEKLFTWSGLISPSSFSFSSNFAAISGCFAVKNCLIKTGRKIQRLDKVLGTEHL